MPYPRTCFSRPYPTRRSARWIGIVAGLALTAAVLDTLPAKAAPSAEADAVPAANVTTQTVGANFDTFVQNTFTTDQSTTTELKIGTYDGGTNKARSYLRFDNQEWLWDKQIQSATLNLWEHHSFSCTAKEWQAWRTPDVTNAVRWSNQPAWIEKVGTSTQTKGFSSSCGDGWVTIPVTAAFQHTATNRLSKTTIGLQAASETDSYGWKRLNSREAASNPPSVTIVYQTKTAVNAQATAPETACATGTDRPYIRSLNPQLRAQISDGVGAQVSATFEWKPVGGTTSTVTAGPGASGSWLAATVGPLTEGGSYAWRAQGSDGTTAGDWSPWCEFTVDTVAPGSAPAVSSTTYPAGQWSGGAGVAGTFSFGTSGVSDVVAYEYGVDSNPPDQVVNGGATASVSITPTADGPHTLWVRTRDRAGNRSPLTSYSFSVGGGAVIAPKNGDVSAAKTSIVGVGRSTATGVTYQWRRGDTDAWTTVPAAHVTVAAGGGAVTWPLSTSGGGEFPKLNWNLEATLAAADAQSIPRDGPVQLRGTFTGGTAASSGAVKLTFDRNLASAAASVVGPGEVNLLTGNFTMADADVTVDAYGSDLTVSRTYNTRRAGQTDQSGMFGPGWISGALVEEAETPYTSLGVFGSLVQVGLPDGDTVGFTARNGTDFDPEVGQEFLRLTYASATDSYKLSDHDGTSVTFSRVTGSAAGTYYPTATTQPGSNQTTTYVWEKVVVAGTEVVRTTQMLAPVPDGVNCTTLSRGCRALSFTYATATTATGSTLGDYAGRVKQISFTAWDPDTAAMRTVPMAAYEYDSTGRLRGEWDPRVGSTAKETYTYQADGVLSSVNPACQEPWQFSYTTVGGDVGAGRLHKVTRSTATTTVGYKVPLSGAGAPHDLSPEQTKRWGQLEAPTDATAISPADEAPGGWGRTTVSYLDANGRLVNEAKPGGNISTSWYDGFGNVIRSLTAENRARALNDSDNIAVALVRSTLNTYSLDGLRLETMSEPETNVQLADGTLTRGRQVVRSTYDQGAPTTGGPYDLVTTEETLVRHWGTNGTAIEADRRVTTTGYNWSLRQPTVTTTDPGGLGQTVRNTLDPVTGLVTSTTQVAGGTTTNTPATRKTIYYRATSGSGYPECDLRPEWANLPCRVQPGGQPASGPELPATATTYDVYHQPRVKTEKTSAGTLRTTTTSYDAAGWVLETAVSATAGTAVPIQRNVYDAVTGDLLRSQSVVGGTVTAEVVRGYDTLGQLTSYQDADGNVSTTGYDLLGRVATSFDGKTTRTYSYDARGLLTAVNDGDAGAYTGSYDADGRLTTETWPNGVKVETSYDESGNEAGLTYSKPGCAAADCVLFRESLTRTPHGQTAKRVSTLSSQSYTHDKAGRVTAVDDTVGEQCTTRTYGFNVAADRLTSSQYAPAADGSCQSGTAASTRGWTYDAADRVTSAGYGYDALGRTTTVPAVDTGVPAAGAATIGYHANDLVDTITQSGRTTDYTIDVTGERIRSWTDNATGAVEQKTQHYDSDDDKPVWTQEGPDRFTRYVAGLAGLTAVVNSDSGVPEWLVTDLSGDVVATIHNGDTGLSTTSEADEYGVSRDPEAVGKQRYGWLGGEQRAADSPGGLVLMGVRLYSPVTGRFLQTDPVYGGSCNAYEYTCAEPVDTFDLDGKKAKKKKKKWKSDLLFWVGPLKRFGKAAAKKAKWLWNGYKRAYIGFHKWGYKQHRNVARWSWKWTKRGWRKLFG